MSWWVKQVSSTSTKVTVTQNASDPLDIAGPYATQAAAQAAAAGINAGGGASASSLQMLEETAGLGLGPVNEATPNPLAWEEALMQFLRDLTSEGTWIRVGKVAIGLVLITVGVAQLAEQSQTVRAVTGTAKTAAKVAAL